MIEAATRVYRSKYAWREIRRSSLPKRPAEERICDFHEIYSLFDEAEVREQASRCLQCPHPSCMLGCPLANRIPEWLALAAEGDFLGAARISQSTSNMPELCSRVCPQERLCEGSCILNGRSEPVAIGAVERFINEYAFAHGAVPVDRAPDNGLRVAVIGAGPGGLACADELAKLGYEVTVFEAHHEGGGLLRYGIPSFKLEKDLVSRRVKVLKDRAVTFMFGAVVGRSIPFGELRNNYDAIFLGIGAQEPKSLDIPGAELKGVSQALPFLVEHIDENSIGTLKGKRLAVLGGGDTAMDCLRTALRCGASEAVCLYRRDLANMPGSRKEYQNALEEGARFQFLANPIALQGSATGHVTGVTCVRMALGEPDPQGRRKPRAVPGSEFTVPADLVLAAYGFDPVPFPPGSELAEVAVNDWGAVLVDANQMTNLAGVFAGGDTVRGPSLVVHAVRDGREAAQGIHRYLQGNA